MKDSDNYNNGISEDTFWKPGILEDAKRIWEYHHISGEVSDSDGKVFRESAGGREERAGGSKRGYSSMECADLSSLVWDPERDRRADLILGFGSHDSRTALRCAELYLAGAAGVILFTGGWGRITGSLWQEPEAAIFRRLAMRAGVPAAAILTEDKASNTGENIRFAREIVRRLASDQSGRRPLSTEPAALYQSASQPPASARGRDGADTQVSLPGRANEAAPDNSRPAARLRILAVDKPARERRTLAALIKQWPGPEFRITSPLCTFEECLQFYREGSGGTGLTARRFINMMIGDLKKMEEYAELGFQIPQEIPDDVRRACRRLLKAGFGPE